MTQAPQAPQKNRRAAGPAPLRNRLLITGTPGSGKSSLIRALSEIPPVVSDIYANVPGDRPPELEEGSVEVDHGLLRLDADHALELYATPGQLRFRFMWEILSRRALGLVVLADSRRPNPVADMHIYLENFGPLFPDASIVVGLSLPANALGSDPAPFVESLRERGSAIPVIPVDLKNPLDAHYLAQALLCRALAARRGP